MKKFLWLFPKTNNNNQIFLTIEMLTRFTFFEPEITHCIYGANLSFLQQSNIKKIEETEKSIEEVMKDFEPTKIIMICNVSNAYHFQKNCPVITYLFSSYPYTNRYKIEPILNQADHIIVPSKFMRDHLMTYFNNKYKIDYMYLGVESDEEFTRKEARDILKKYKFIMNDTFVILNGCPNVKKSRFDILIKSFAKLLKKNPEKPIVLFLLCQNNVENSGWNIMELAQTEFKNNNLENPEKFIKFVSPNNNFILNVLLHSVNIGVNTSDGTDFPLFNILFATRNIPQIVGDYGGFPEWFDTRIPHKDEYVHSNNGNHPGGEGYLMDEDKLVETIQMYVDNTVERKKYSKTNMFKWKPIFQMFSKFVLNCNKEIKDDNKDENSMVRSLS